MSLVYQPIVSIDRRTGGVVGHGAHLGRYPVAKVECLWRPGRGRRNIGMGKFISDLETSGKIIHIDRFILQRVMNTLRENFWATMPDGCRMTANVSGQSASRPQFWEWLSESMGGDGAHRSLFGWLDIEITEYLPLDHRSAVIRDSIGEFRRRGGRILMDDFGTGFATHDALRAWPDIDGIKIDRSLLMRAFADGQGRGRVQSQLLGALEYAALNDMEIVFEGVEEPAHLLKTYSMIEEIGCEHAVDAYAQGYLIGRPAPSVASMINMDERVKGWLEAAGTWSQRDGRRLAPDARSLGSANLPSVL